MIALPKPPKGWEWAPNSQVLASTYNDTTRITLLGPTAADNVNRTSVGGPGFSHERPTYSAGLKKFSACCGIGHAVHFVYPSKPEKDKLLLLLQAIEEQNAFCKRTFSILSITMTNAYAPVLREAMVERGWTQGWPGFKNYVWKVGDPNNNVQVWGKDCTEFYEKKILRKHEE